MKSFYLMQFLFIEIVLLSRIKTESKGNMKGTKINNSKKIQKMENLKLGKLKSAFVEKEEIKTVPKQNLKQNVKQFKKGKISPFKRFLNKGIYSTFLPIFVSGIGDKSFLIVAFLSAENDKFIVFIASFLSLLLNGAISIQIGKFLPMILAKNKINLIGGIIFILLGAYFILKNIFYGEDKEEEDLIKEEKESKSENKFKIFNKTFLLVFLAELGDKSQIAIISLSNIFSSFYICLLVIAISNFLLIIMAIFSGKILLKYISKFYVEFISGFLFIIFGILFIY